MFEGYKPTVFERRAILAGYAVVERFADKFCSEANNLMRSTLDERRGYGHRADALPLLAARALIVKWFREGTQEPDALLRDTYNIRPAALWAQGFGARVGHIKGVSTADCFTLDEAVAAHHSAFIRMAGK
jgi:hypothetical protein